MFSPRPAARQQAVYRCRERWKLSERHACGLVGISRSSARYKTRRSGDQELRERLRALAGLRRRFGYRRLCVLLRREGFAVNHKRVYRLYREEGLLVPKTRRKRVSRKERLPLLFPAPNQPWSLDFIEDTLSWGRKLRLLTIVDAYSRESLAIESFNGKFRDECLNQHWFRSLPHARRAIEEWRMDYNVNRPHSSLGNLTPEEFRLDYAMRPVAAGL